MRWIYMRLLFSMLTIIFAILGLTKMLSNDFAMPLTFVCLAITNFVTSKEYKDMGKKRSSACFLLLGIFLLLVTIYNTASTIWGI